MYLVNDGENRSAWPSTRRSLLIASTTIQFAANNLHPPRIMRGGYFVFATIVTLLASVNAGPASTASIDRKRFTITSPESNETLDGVYIQSGGEKFLILRLGDDAVQSDESSTDNDKSSSSDEKSGSDGQEERAFGVSASTTTKLSKQFSGEYDTFTNKLLWKFFHVLNPKKLPDPPRIPPRMRGRLVAPKVDG